MRRRPTAERAPHPSTPAPPTRPVREVGPWVPPGRYLDLPGRGRTWVRELAGPPGAPALVLIHGWTATSELNWFPVFADLGRRWRVIAMDQRFHGRGIRCEGPFRLDDCADDVAALITALGLDAPVVVGYSMGGAIAQLVARRHRELIGGAVLCATSFRFRVRTVEKAQFAALAAVAPLSRMLPEAVTTRAALRLGGGRSRHRDRIGRWGLELLGRHCWRGVVEAGMELARFDSRAWLGNLTSPVAVVATMDDDIVPSGRQLALARAVPTATLHPTPGGHDAVFAHSTAFADQLGAAVRSVLDRRRTAAPEVAGFAQLPADPTAVA